MKRFLSVITLMAILAAMFSIPALAYKGEHFPAKVLTYTSTIYKKDSSSSKRVAVLMKGDTVTVTDYSGKWAKVKYDGKKGYMKIAELVAKYPTKIVKTKHETVIEYIKGAKGVAILKKGKTLYVYGKDGKGNYLVGNEKQSKLGYVAISDVKVI